jgi:hypothetical protein
MLRAIMKIVGASTSGGASDTKQPSLLLLNKKAHVFERARIVARKGAKRPIFEGNMPPKKVYPQYWRQYWRHNRNPVKRASVSSLLCPVLDLEESEEADESVRDRASSSLLPDFDFKMLEDSFFLLSKMVRVAGLGCGHKSDSASQSSTLSRSLMYFFALAGGPVFIGGRGGGLNRAAGFV